MPPDTAAAAEARFRRLVADADLPPPDAMTREASSLTFYWDAPQVAVVVELEDPVPEKT
jgi:hypothetical protein